MLYIMIGNETTIIRSNSVQYNSQQQNKGKPTTKTSKFQYTKPQRSTSSLLHKDHLELINIQMFRLKVRIRGDLAKFYHDKNNEEVLFNDLNDLCGVKKYEINKIKFENRKSTGEHEMIIVSRTGHAHSQLLKWNQNHLINNKSQITEERVQLFT